MKISCPLHRKLYYKNLCITGLWLLLFCLLAWLSNRYNIYTDLTANSRNSLSEHSKKLLDSLDDTLKITVYIDDKKPLRQKIKKILNRYTLYRPDIQVQFINPLKQPETLRDADIDEDGAVFVAYQGRREKLKVINESSLSNAIYRLSSVQKRWLSFLTGHGERSPNGKRSRDLGIFGQELKKRQINIVNLNLTKIPAIPDNSSVLVLASPEVKLLDGEMAIILDYINSGGNLLWLLDPASAQLPKLATRLGLTVLPGTLIDASSSLYGIDDPSYVIVSDYAKHPLSKNLQTMTVYPVTAALNLATPTGFQAAPLLTSSTHSWTETGILNGKIGFDAHTEEQEGPLPFAWALTRKKDGHEQRIFIIGDSDFLTNAYIGNVGNQDFGLRLINWLTYDDRHIDIPEKIIADRRLDISRPLLAALAFAFLIVLPLALFGSGLFIWRRRKRY